MKIQIKNRWDDSVIFECEANSIKLAVKLAIEANANLSSADLSYADLSSASLSSANLSFASLSFANLSSADLSYADLRYANLRNADLRYADLRYAKQKIVSICALKFILNVTPELVFIGCLKLTHEKAMKFTLKAAKKEGLHKQEFTELRTMYLAARKIVLKETPTLKVLEKEEIEK